MSSSHVQGPTLECAVLPVLGWDLSPETIRNTKDLADSFSGSRKHTKFAQKFLVKQQTLSFEESRKKNAQGKKIFIKKPTKSIKERIKSDAALFFLVEHLEKQRFASRI